MFLKVNFTLFATANSFKFLIQGSLTMVFFSLLCVYTVCYKLFKTSTSGFCLPQTTFLDPLCGSFR